MRGVKRRAGAGQDHRDHRPQRRTGKSTLLRALVKEVRADSGRIEFHCGHDHSQPNPDHVGYVPQRLRIEANLPLTVYDLFGMALQRRPLFLGARAKCANA